MHHSLVYLADVEMDPHTSPTQHHQNNQQQLNNNQPTVVNQGRAEQALSKKDIRMASILLTIVMVFLICHLPR